MMGNTIPARASFQPRSLKVYLPWVIINVPVTAISIKEMPKISE
jgi:hypothetical protein